MQLGDPEAEGYRLLGREWAKLDGAASRLEEMKKIVLAEIKQRSDEKTQDGKETAALSSPQYAVHIDKMIEARTAANVCKADVRAVEMNNGTWRTRESTKRAEMNLR